jgi:hypothetical protein
VSAARWSGPYCSAQTATGGTLDWNPLADRRALRGAVKFVVRWRVTGFPNPRKRTFPDAVGTEDWARRIEATRVLRSGCDTRGWPVDHVPPAGGHPADGGAPVPAVPSSAPQNRPGTTAVGPAAATEGRSDAAPTDGASTPAVTAAATEAGRLTPGDMPDLPGAERGPLGRDVAGYIDELIELYRPSWEQQGDEGRGVGWWTGQLEFVKAVLRYDDG